MENVSCTFDSFVFACGLAVALWFIDLQEEMCLSLNIEILIYIDMFLHAHMNVQHYTTV